MVDRTYLTGTAPPPGRWTVFVHQTLLPGAIDAAGAAEQALARVASVARRRPLPALMVALCAGFAAALSARRAPR